MKRFFELVVFLVAAAPALVARGHGTPIHIDVQANRLVVSQGLTDDNGFAAMIFLEDDEDGEPFGTLVLPQVGPVIVWQLPGLEIVGMDEQSNLSIEVLLRPAMYTNPVEERLVWHWDPTTETVETSASEFYLLGSGMRFQALNPAASAPPPPFLLADPIAGQQGFHNHGLLSYALDNDPPPPAGGYGFFARFTSDLYAASDPFLLVFNREVDPTQMQAAGLAINAAAFLPGDYNHDDHVDAADYVVWRKTFGSTTQLSADGSGNDVVDEADYGVWRTHFGHVFDGAGDAATVVASIAMPEPGSAALAACVILAVWTADVRKRRIARRTSTIGSKFN